MPDPTAASKGKDVGSDNDSYVYSDDDGGGDKDGGKASSASGDSSYDVDLEYEDARSAYSYDSKASGKSKRSDVSKRSGTSRYSYDYSESKYTAASKYTYTTASDTEKGSDKDNGESDKDSYDLDDEYDNPDSDYEYQYSDNNSKSDGYYDYDYDDTLTVASATPREDRKQQQDKNANDDELTTLPSPRLDGDDDDLPLSPEDFEALREEGLGSLSPEEFASLGATSRAKKVAEEVERASSSPRAEQEERVAAAAAAARARLAGDEKAVSRGITNVTLFASPLKPATDSPRARKEGKESPDTSPKALYNAGRDVVDAIRMANDTELPKLAGVVDEAVERKSHEIVPSAAHFTDDQLYTEEDDQLTPDLVMVKFDEKKAAVAHLPKYVHDVRDMHEVDKLSTKEIRRLALNIDPSRREKALRLKRWAAFALFTAVVLGGTSALGWWYEVSGITPLFPESKMHVKYFSSYLRLCVNNDADCGEVDYYDNKLLGCGIKDGFTQEGLMAFGRLVAYYKRMPPPPRSVPNTSAASSLPPAPPAPSPPLPPPLYARGSCTTADKVKFSLFAGYYGVLAAVVVQGICFIQILMASVSDEKPCWLSCWRSEHKMLMGNCVVIVCSLIFVVAGTLAFQMNFPFGDVSILPYGDASRGMSESYGVGWYTAWVNAGMAVLATFLLAAAARAIALSPEEKSSVESEIKVYLGDAYDVEVNPPNGDVENGMAPRRDENDELPSAAHVASGSALPTASSGMSVDERYEKFKQMARDMAESAKNFAAEREMQEKAAGGVGPHR